MLGREERRLEVEKEGGGEESEEMDWKGAGVKRAGFLKEVCFYLG